MLVSKNPKYRFNFNYLKIIINCRFFYMRIILLFLVLFNYSSLVTSCPSSGDGDCVPSTDTYNQSTNQSSYQTVTEIPSMNTSSNYSIDDLSLIHI